MAASFAAGVVRTIMPLYVSLAGLPGGAVLAARMQVVMAPIVVMARHASTGLVSGVRKSQEDLSFVRY